MKPEEKIVEIGNEFVIIDKVFGPLDFAKLRIKPDIENCEWVIERKSFIKIVRHEKYDEYKDTWVEWVRIPGQIEQDYPDSIEETK